MGKGMCGWLKAKGPGPWLSEENGLSSACSRATYFLKSAKLCICVELKLSRFFAGYSLKLVPK
jgi:hypothetical protein